MRWHPSLSAPMLGALLVVAGCDPTHPPGAPDGTPGSAGTARPPNIVLLISDDHGYPDYGFMGSRRVRTPELDRLAREGVAFSHGYSSASVCRPALATLLTGLTPLALKLEEQARRRSAALGKRPEPPRGSFASTLETLPRLLAERGYVSFQAGKHWEGSFRDAGFDEGMVEAQVRGGGDATMHELVRNGVGPLDAFLRRNADRPFFVWFAPMLPHLPHDAPDRFQRLYAGLDRPTARYYASVSWLDDAIGQLVGRIRELGLEERTLFVYVADNGWDPEIGEGWIATLGGHKGKLSLHELGFRTPVILRWRGGVEAQPMRDELVSFTDVFTTILDFAGARLPERREGHSLRPLVEGRQTWPRRDLVGWMRRSRSAEAPSGFVRAGSFWRDARWHYLEPSGLPPELFDLEADPRETRDVAADHPEVVAHARARLAEWAAGLGERARPAARPGSRPR